MIQHSKKGVTSNNGMKLCYGKFRENIRKSFLAAKCIRLYNRLLRDMGGALSLGTFKSRVDKILVVVQLTTILCQLVDGQDNLIGISQIQNPWVQFRNDVQGGLHQTPLLSDFFRLMTPTLPQCKGVYIYVIYTMGSLMMV